MIVLSSTPPLLLLIRVLQLSPEAQPLDQLDALGLSVMQELGSNATTGVPTHTHTHSLSL